MLPVAAATVSLLVLTARSPKIVVLPVAAATVSLLVLTARFPKIAVFPVAAATVSLLVLTDRSLATANVPTIAVFPVAAATVSLLTLIARSPAIVVLPVAEATVNLLVLIAKSPNKEHNPVNAVTENFGETVVPTVKLPILLRVPVAVAPRVPRDKAELLLIPSWIGVSAPPLKLAEVVVSSRLYEEAIVFPVKAAIGSSYLSSINS